MKALKRFSALGPFLALTFLGGFPALAQQEVRGIDLSHHSGDVDWQQLKASGFQFVYLKATEGDDDLDPRFADYWQQAAEAGLPRGAYHFYVTEDDPDVQAAFFLGTVPEDDLGELVPVVDVELIGHGTQEDWPQNLRIFVEKIEAHFGTKPMIYTGPNFWDAHLADHDYAHYPLWIAQYEVESPTVPGTWKEWTVWQYEGDQAVPGVESDADVSKLRPGATLEELFLPRAAEGEAEPSDAAPDAARLDR